MRRDFYDFALKVNTKLKLSTVSSKTSLRACRNKKIAAPNLF